MQSPARDPDPETPEAAKPSANMREVARLAGVSVGAVSKAFHHHPSIPKRTRERILSVAAEIGYAPNPELSRILQTVARSRHQHDRPAIGVLFPWSDGFNALENSEPTLNKVWRGLQHAAESLGYNVTPFWFKGPHMSAARIIGILRARGLEALILFCSPEAYPEAYEKELLDLSDISCVAFGRVAKNRPPITIEVDAFESSRLAMSRAKERGYKTPGIVLVDRNIEFDNGRFQSALDYHRSKLFPDAPPVPDFIMQTPHDRLWAQPQQSDIKRLRKWISSHQPDVLFCHYNELRQWVEELGIRVPKDMGIVSLNNPGVLNNTGITFDWEYVGSKSVVLMDQLLAKHLHGVPKYSEYYLIGPSWVEGTSLSKRNRACPSKPKPARRKR